MLGGQITLVLSVLMLTSGVALNRVMLNGYDSSTMMRLVDHENFFAISASAFLSSVGAVLFLAAVSLMFVNRANFAKVDA